MAKSDSKGADWIQYRR